MSFDAHYCDWCGAGDAKEAEPIDARVWLHSFEGEGGISFGREQEIWQQQNEMILSGELSNVKGYSDEQMVGLYNVFDIYLSLSGGEGFCMPVLESMACEVPVVYTDYSAQAEVASGAGLPVRSAAYIVEHNTSIERHIGCLAHAIQQIRLLRDPEERAKIGTKGRQIAKEKFDLNLIVTQWDEALQEMAEKSKATVFGRLV